MQLRFLVVASSLLLACSSARPAVVAEVMTPQTQQAMSPEAALERLKEGNRRFAEGQPLPRDLRAQVKGTAEGQSPFAVVLSCLDSRIPVEHVFDQGIGDVFTARVAGNIINEEILGSMEFATRVVGAKVIMVVGHDRCGAVKGACDNVQLGHISSLVSAIQPSVTSVAGPTCTSKDAALVDHIAEHNVDRTLREIRERSPLLREMEAAGTIKLAGAMYDLDTGRVTFR